MFYANLRTHKLHLINVAQTLINYNFINAAQTIISGHINYIFMNVVETIHLRTVSYKCCGNSHLKTNKLHLYEYCADTFTQLHLINVAQTIS